MIAPQHDLLTREARNMIMRLAGIESLVGEEEFSFEREGYRWRLPVGVNHGFTHMILGSSKVQRDLDKIEYEKVCSEIHEWLTTGPFA